MNLLVKKLQTKGVKPVKLSKWTEFSDPSIWITESIYVQIGVDYVSVVRDRPTGLAMYETDGSLEDLLIKLKQAIDEGKPK